MRLALTGILIIPSAFANSKTSQDYWVSGWASLPSETIITGPVSGHFIEPSLGVTTPFMGQPIPGWSGLLHIRDAIFWGMPDNGFGSKYNSQDFVLGMYRFNANVVEQINNTSKQGAIQIEKFLPFNDKRGILKNGKGVDFPITADFTQYKFESGRLSEFSVAQEIREQRWLTGFDFDVESVVLSDDGSFWVGEEFGPFLLHFDSSGALLEEPVPHPSLFSPFNPEVLAGLKEATLPASRGFEALAKSDIKSQLLVVPEAVSHDVQLRVSKNDERLLEIFIYDTSKKQYLDKTYLYRKDGEKTRNTIVIGDMVALGNGKYMLIERDSLFGENAKLKRIYQIDLKETDSEGVLDKSLLVDLLDIPDPHYIAPSSSSGIFSLPFDSIEGLAVLDKYTIAVSVDTNFPNQNARGGVAPDDTEIVFIRFNNALL
ncbi:hypothetical protein GAGA_4470 [Paraglaciecola agarilytica NO2]|uniref:Phytase-like domain-containing protein n=2 Tax=Paraglaciecola chathamensis TaxID=368405 RepID=A0ABQ0ID29_9ALTE|nr:hypothetical protein GAGA_4470 [Paraglaciecola agarilytica NO2]